MYYVECILLALIVAFIVDYSGVVAVMKQGFGLEGRSMKPFDCSMCMTFWSCLFLMAFRGLSIPHLAGACFAAFLARFAGDGIFLLSEALSTAIRVLSNKLNRIL